MLSNHAQTNKNGVFSNGPKHVFQGLADGFGVYVTASRTMFVHANNCEESTPLEKKLLAQESIMNPVDVRNARLADCLLFHFVVVDWPSVILYFIPISTLIS